MIGLDPAPSSGYGIPFDLDQLFDIRFTLLHEIAEPDLREQRIVHIGARVAEMERMDAKLDSLVAAMNAATGDDKVNAVAAVLEELVGQRKAMREKMQQGQMSMMPRMGGAHDKEDEAEGDERSSDH